MKRAAIGGIHRRVREVFGQLGRILVQIDDQLGKVSRRQLGQVQLVLRGHIDRRFVHDLGDFEHELIAGFGAQEFETALFVKDEEIG